MFIDQPNQHKNGGPTAAAEHRDNVGPSDPVQQSNSPTHQQRANSAASGVEMSDEAERATAEDLHPKLMHFYTELRHGLPDRYVFDEQTKFIFDIAGSKVCGPIRVVSLPHRPDLTGWSVEVEYLDREENLRGAASPRQEIITGKGRFFSHLIDRGFEVATGALGVAMLLNAWTNLAHSWRCDHSGWFRAPDGAMSFVRNDGTVHMAQKENAIPIILANPQLAGAPIRGSLAGWQKEVAARALGNPALMFAISVAIAGPLLRFTGIHTAGFNFFGTSGVGKSLLLRIAESCGGNPRNLTPWSAAKTGLGQLGTRSYDGLLALDGFRRDPDARQIKALLAIADEAGSDPDPNGEYRWQGVLLSGSEVPFTAMFQRKKKGVPAALLARIVDIPATSGPHGLIDTLHGFADRSSFARHVEAAVHHQHGHLLPAFLDRLVADLAGIAADLGKILPQRAHFLKDSCLASSNVPAAALPQVAERFALIGYAGELGIRFGLLPWSPGAAQLAAEAMAHRVKQDNGPSDAERARSTLWGFVDRNADSIIDLESEGAKATCPGTVGWRDSAYIYIRPGPLRDQIADLDDLLDALEPGTLKPGGEAGSLQYKMPATKVSDRPRVYRFDAQMLQHGLRPRF